jgi:hypothetical protein
MTRRHPFVRVPRENPKKDMRKKESRLQIFCTQIFSFLANGQANTPGNYQEKKLHVNRHLAHTCDKVELGGKFRRNFSDDI